MVLKIASIISSTLIPLNDGKTSPFWARTCGLSFIMLTTFVFTRWVPTLLPTVVLNRWWCLCSSWVEDLRLSLVSSCSHLSFQASESLTTILGSWQWWVMVNVYALIHLDPLYLELLQTKNRCRNDNWQSIQRVGVEMSFEKVFSESAGGSSTRTTVSVRLRCVCLAASGPMTS
jgi:hypothetical protein